MRELSGSPEIDAYLTYLAIERGRSPRTIESYRRDLVALEAALTAEHGSIRAASAAQLDAHLDRLRRAGRSPATLSRARSSMRGLYGFLADEGGLDADPMVTSGTISVPARLPKALPEDEVAQLLDGISGSDPLLEEGPGPARAALRHGRSCL